MTLEWCDRLCVRGLWKHADTRKCIATRAFQTQTDLPTSFRCANLISFSCFITLFFFSLSGCCSITQLVRFIYRRSSYCCGPSIYVAATKYCHLLTIFCLSAGCANRQTPVIVYTHRNNLAKIWLNVSNRDKKVKLRHWIKI